MRTLTLPSMLFGSGNLAQSGSHHRADGTLGEHSQPEVAVHTSLIVFRYDRTADNAVAVGCDCQRDLHLVEIEHAGIGGPATANEIPDRAALVGAK